jgi:putative inorganic carbon (HCO3(-)) transporter
LAHVIILLVAWGALTFGAVYPWGYGPLAAASLIAGLAALIGCRRGRVPAALTATVTLLAVSILVQQMPMPRGVLERISPATVHLLAERDIAFGADVSAWHPLTIDPTRTWTGLFLVVSLAALWLGLAAAMTERLLFRIAGGIVTVGCAIAVIGILGLANHTGKVLGFWQPLSHAAPFGPFVNRNHYAGWMLMTVPFGFGYLLSLLTRSGAVRPRSWRARIAWLSTRQANLTIMLALALTVMVLSVLASLSRSGILCLLVSLLAFGWYATRKIARRRALAIACVIAVATGCVGWAGVDRIGSRFAEFGSNRSGGRFGIWHDATAVARAFPFAGTGFDTFGVAMVAYQTADPDQHYEEAHNDYLQIAAEGGLLVGIPALALLIVVARQVWLRFREQRDSRSVFWVRAGAVAGLLTIALQEATDFSLQMPGNAALFCVLAAIAVHRSAREPVSRTVAEVRGRISAISRLP